MVKTLYFYIKSGPPRNYFGVVCWFTTTLICSILCVIIPFGSFFGIEYLIVYFFPFMFKFVFGFDMFLLAMLLISFGIWMWNGLDSDSEYSKYDF